MVSCHDRTFLCCDRDLSRQKGFVPRQSVAKVKRFCVATELAKARRFSIATEYFMSQQSWPRQEEIMSQ